MQLQHNAAEAFVIDGFIYFFPYPFQSTSISVKKVDTKDLCEREMALLLRSLVTPFKPVTSLLLFTVVNVFFFLLTHLTRLKSSPFSRCLASRDRRVSVQREAQSWQPLLGQCALSPLAFYKSMARP